MESKSTHASYKFARAESIRIRYLDSYLFNITLINWPSKKAYELELYDVLQHSYIVVFECLAQLKSQTS